MYFLIIQLFRTEYKEDLLLALKTCGINTGCTIEGENLETALEHGYPLFKGLLHAAHERDRHCLLVTGIIDDPGAVENLVELLNDADIDIRKERIMRFAVMPMQLLQDNETEWKLETS